MRLVTTVIALLVSCAFFCRSACAAETESELAELRARVEALEQQNESLRQSVGTSTFAETGPVLQAEELGRHSELESHLAENSPCPECESSEDDLKMSAHWNHGLELQTEDKAFRVHVGGRTQFDAGWLNADQSVQDNINNPYEDGVDFRRGRFRIDGTMYHTIDWAAEYDFFAGTEINGTEFTHPAPTDLWVTFKEVPWVGNIRAGGQKPAIGFEHQVSSRFLPFMERSYNQDAFYGGAFNGFWPGVSFFDNYGEQDVGVWNVGVFKPTNNVFGENANDGDYAAVTRLTYLPWYECEGANLLHVGASFMQRTTVEDTITFRTRDAIRTGLSTDWPVPATTGSIFGDDMQWLNGELVGVCGPWTFQSEYLVSHMDDAAPIIGGVVQPSVGAVTYHGGYVQLLVFLTGEHDNYNKQAGAFERVIPYENFYFRRGWAMGPGAWQVGARYNYLDLNDDGLEGGILHNFTGGLNWFLNPNMKLQFDSIATHRDAPLGGGVGDGWIYGFGTRLAYDF